MIWYFTLIKNGLDIPIENPMGWNTIGKIIQRDKDKHGIFLNFSEQKLTFVDNAYWIIKEEDILNGVDGDIKLRIEWSVETEDALNLFYFGKLDFERLTEFCGDYCSISMGLQASEIEVLINNRMDIAVDLTNGKAYDGVTTLPAYTGINFKMEIPGKAIRLVSEALKTSNTSYNVTDDSNWGGPGVTGTGQWQGAFMPGLDNVKLRELDPFNPKGVDDYLRPWSSSNTGTSEIMEVKELTELKCKSTDLTFQGRYKGRIKFNGQANKDIRAQLLVKEIRPNSGGIDDRFSRQIAANGFYTGDKTFEFDVTFSFTVATAPIGTKYYFLIFLQNTIVTTGSRSLIVDTDKETYFRVFATSLCPPSTTNTFLINEALSRVVENLTNNAYHFKSSFYGRLDSQPYQAKTDGCGSLRTLSSGMFLRRAVLQDNTQPKAFTTLKEAYDSLNAIDCIGMGVEGNNVVFEEAKYFYSDKIMFIADGVKEITVNVDIDSAYNQFKFGYKKFETESTNGLDAMHTDREYRNLIINSKNSLEKLSDFLADGYAIEETRRKFGLSDDWRYDDNIFIICLKRVGLVLKVEQGNISAPENMFDPPTVLNYAITPLRMGLKWFKWFMQAVKGQKKMLFNRGSGNYVAKGKKIGECIIEKDVLAENQVVTTDTFANIEESVSFTEIKNVSFSFPVSLVEFVKMYDIKYGLIQYRKTANDGWQYGWLDSLKYEPEDGIAEFTLIKKP